MDDFVLLSKVLEDATILRAPEMVCLHKGCLHLGPGGEYLECSRCSGRWRAKVADLPVREKEEVVMLYRNWKGKTRGRRIRPKRIFFGSNEWHPKEQWLLEAIDLEKNEVRIFAMGGIVAWQ